MHPFNDDDDGPIHLYDPVTEMRRRRIRWLVMLLVIVLTVANEYIAIRTYGLGAVFGFILGVLFLSLVRGERLLRRGDRGRLR